jgi:hypothetical protein
MQISLTVLALFYKRADGRTKQSSLALCMDSNARKNKLSPSFGKLFYRIMTPTNQVIRHTYKLEVCLHACMRAHRRLTAFVRQYNSLYPLVPMWNTGPSTNSSIWSLLSLVLLHLSNFSQHSAMPIPFQAVLGLHLFLIP